MAVIDCLSLQSYFLIIGCFDSQWFATTVQGNPYWAMMHTNSYKYGYSGPGNYYSYAHVYDIDDYMHRADGGRRVWDNTTPANNVDSANVVLQGSEAPRTTTNTTTEECKFENTKTQVLKIT